MKTKYLKINPADNVAVAIVDLKAGEVINVDNVNIHLNQDIPAGHKVALQDFTEGENVIKYGYPIGHAIKNLKQGDWMIRILKQTWQACWIILITRCLSHLIFLKRT